MKAHELTITLFALLPFAGCVLPSDDEDTGNQSGTEESSGTDPSTTAPGTSSSGESAESTSTGGGESSSSGEATTGDPPPTNCATATLLMGNPYFDGDLEGWNPAGQGMLDDPPLRSRHLASLPGDRIAIETQFEVWGAENGQMHRIAGMEVDTMGDTRYEPNGACEDVRVLIAAGITGLPDGRIAVADTRGNGLVELRDPFGDCQGAAIAGNPDLTYDVDVPSTGTAAAGDIDGPGAMARFNGVERPVSDEDGNIYVVDTGNHALKRIADDADRTVSTVFRYEDALPMAMTVLDGTLYVTGTTTGADIVWAIDIATGTREVLFEDRGLFEEIGESSSATMYGLANDGVDLLVASGEGYIFRMSTAAEPLGVVAGYGEVVDYPPDLDLSMPIPTTELPIRSYAVALADLVRAGNDFMFTNNNPGVGFHVWSIHCE